MQRPHTHGFFAYALILTLIGSLFSFVLPAIPPAYALHQNITVNIDLDPVTHLYEDNDSVLIRGVVDNVIDGEDVVIRIGEPGDSPSQVEQTEPDSDGDFVYNYEIPGSPTDGVYTVEVEYDDDFAYTYFIVDEDNDTVSVELLNDNSGIYEAGDEVEIGGLVDDVDTSEDIVEITVLDPFNNEIFEDEPAELGEGSGVEDDEYVFSFDLENDAVHGRYAILVTYEGDTDQEGSVLFEIEDDEEGNEEEDDCEGGRSDSEDDLFAEMGADSYEPGDTVCISGTIDNYDDNVDLEIVVEDPDEEEVDDYGEDNVNVEDNGDFIYEFTLENDADEGGYTAIVTYDDMEVTLEFDVAEEGGSGSDEDITVKLNKASYLAGESMTVTGTVSDVADPDDEEELSVFIYRPSGQVIFESGTSRYVTPSSNGAYTATIVLPSDLEADEDYTVKVSYQGETVEATFDITGVSTNPGDRITVQTDQDEYNIGATMRISGQVPSVLIEGGQQVLIRINKPDGNPCRIEPINLPSSGAYSYNMVLGGLCSVPGEYEVEVTYGDEDANTSFELFGSSTSYNLNVEGDVYPIEYEVSNGAISNMFVRPSENKLVVSMNAEQDGQLTVVLPREVIDAIQSGEDIDYIVVVEDESGNIGDADFEETENTNDERTLVINYEAGTDRIEIIGTRVVPEFGTIAAIVLAVAIVGIIVATTRYGNGFSLFKQ